MFEGYRLSRIPRQAFPASRGLSRRGKLKRQQRPLSASDELFDEAADHISDRNLPVFKTGFVLCVMRMPC